MPDTTCNPSEQNVCFVCLPSHNHPPYLTIMASRNTGYHSPQSKCDYRPFRNSCPHAFSSTKNKKSKKIAKIAVAICTDHTAYAMLEINLKYPQPDGRMTISLVLYLKYPVRDMKLSTKDMRTVGTVLTSAGWKND